MLETIDDVVFDAHRRRLDASPFCSAQHLYDAHQDVYTPLHHVPLVSHNHLSPL